MAHPSEKKLFHKYLPSKYRACFSSNNDADKLDKKDTSWADRNADKNEKIAIKFLVKNLAGKLSYATDIFEDLGITITYIESLKTDRWRFKYEILVHAKAELRQIEKLKELLSDILYIKYDFDIKE